MSSGIVTGEPSARTMGAPHGHRAGPAMGGETATEKLRRLEDILKGIGSMLVAFSGGVDSTFLLAVGARVLGDKVVAVTAASPTYPERELREAEILAGRFGVRHIVMESNELLIPNFSENTNRRCYYCKGELFEICSRKAEELGLSVVADGSNTDDLHDYRPGRDAARELSVRSPLVEAGLTKQEIRVLSREMGLETWDKPALACLSSRFPYGTRITQGRLDRVAACEEILWDMGFRQFRVRYHGDVARIEVDTGELPAFMDEAKRKEIVKGFKKAGFTYVTLDIEGYRQGSMNEPLANKGY